VQGRLLRDARVAGRCVHLGDGRGEGEGADQGVLAGAGPDDEKLYGTTLRPPDDANGMRPYAGAHPRRTESLMPRALTALPLLLAVALIAGCTGSVPAPAPTPTLRPRRAPFTGAAPGTVLNATLAAARGASSKRVSGTLVKGRETMKFDVASTWEGGGRATGQVTYVHGRMDGRVDFRLIAKKVYLKGDRRFWKSGGLPPVAVLLLSNRWLLADAAEPTLDDLVSMMSPTLTNDVLDLAEDDRAQVKRVAGRTIDGRPTIGLLEPHSSLDSDEEATLYVSTSGSPVPMLLAGKDGSSVTFGGWNEPLTVKAPKGAFDARPAMKAARKAKKTHEAA
jgi:hypothetical protein